MFNQIYVKQLFAHISHVLPLLNPMLGRGWRNKIKSVNGGEKKHNNLDPTKIILNLRLVVLPVHSRFHHCWHSLTKKCQKPIFNHNQINLTILGIISLVFVILLQKCSLHTGCLRKVVQ